MACAMAARQLHCLMLLSYTPGLCLQDSDVRKKGAVPFQSMDRIKDAVICRSVLFLTGIKRHSLEAQSLTLTP